MVYSEETVSDRLQRFASSLVVSCQPVPDGPLDHPEQVVGFALAALASGGRGLRIEGIANLKAVRAATDAPIIGVGPSVRGLRRIRSEALKGSLPCPRSPLPRKTAREADC